MCTFLNANHFALTVYTRTAINAIGFALNEMSSYTGFMLTKHSRKKGFTEGQKVVSHIQPVRRRRLGGRSQRVQAAVFAAAIEALLQNGYEGLGIVDIAKRASVNPASIYRRWGNKETL